MIVFAGGQSEPIYSRRRCSEGEPQPRPTVARGRFERACVTGDGRRQRCGAHLVRVQPGNALQMGSIHEY